MISGPKPQHCRSCLEQIEIKLICQFVCFGLASKFSGRRSSVCMNPSPVALQRPRAGRKVFYQSQSESTINKFVKTVQSAHEPGGLVVKGVKRHAKRAACIILLEL